MPDNSIIFLIVITLLFVGILFFMHRAAKKREDILREQLGNLGLFLDEEKSASQKRVLDLETQMKKKDDQINLKDWEHSRLRQQISDMESEINTRVHTLLYEWRTSEIEKIKEELKTNATHEAKNILDHWVVENEQSIREDAHKRGRAVIAGQVAERFVPFMPSFRYNPKDARFIGSPIDLIVFDGADESDIRRIIFIEVKTGRSQLSERQKQIKKIIESLHSPIVKWERANPDELQAPNTGDAGLFDD